MHFYNLVSLNIVYFEQLVCQKNKILQLGKKTALIAPIPRLKIQIFVTNFKHCHDFITKLTKNDEKRPDIS
jgi:hypothetical protein